MLALTVLALGILVLNHRTASAHNVTASPASSCTGWTYVGNYNNGGGGEAGDNRLVVVDVTIGGTAVQQYQYFDTLTSHPAPPAGFTVVDHPTMVTFTLFSLSGTSFPVAATGSIKMYQNGSASDPSSDPYYNDYVPADSVDPIPAVSSPSECPTAEGTATPSVTSTATATTINTVSTATNTPGAAVLVSTPTRRPVPSAAASRRTPVVVVSGAQRKPGVALALPATGSGPSAPPINRSLFPLLIALAGGSIVVAGLRRKRRMP